MSLGWYLSVLVNIGQTLLANGYSNYMMKQSCFCFGKMSKCSPPPPHWNPSRYMYSMWCVWLCSLTSLEGISLGNVWVTDNISSNNCLITSGTDWRENVEDNGGSNTTSFPRRTIATPTNGGIVPPYRKTNKQIKYFSIDQHVQYMYLFISLYSCRQCS